MSEHYDRLYFRQRNRNRLYDVVAAAVEGGGIRRSDIAKKLGASPSQVSRWLSGPSNWEIDTISDLLWAVRGELDYAFTSFQDRARGNRFHSAGEPARAAALAPTSTTVSEAVFAETAGEKATATAASPNTVRITLG